MPVKKYVIYFLVLSLISISLYGARKILVKREPIEVEVESVKVGDIEEIVPSVTSGTFKPLNEATVSALSLGQIARVNHQVGERGGAGEVIILMDDEELRAELSLARASVDAAKA
jgi:multidrug efflux pump subunit AcrA (membrane-fusion protein)